MALQLIHIAFLFAYIGLNFIVTAFVVQSAFLYFGDRRYAGNEPTDKKPWVEMLLAFAMPFMLLGMFMLARYIAEEHLITFSSALYLGIAPYMIILACAIGVTALRFKQWFLMLPLHLILTALIIWKTNLTEMSSINMKTFYMICAIISFLAFMALAFALRIPQQIRSNTANSNRQIKKIGAALLLIVAFSPPLVMAIIDTNYFGNDVIPYLPWGGVAYLKYAPDGKHIYYTRVFGTNFDAMLNHSVPSPDNIKLFYARSDLKEKRQLPGESLKTNNIDAGVVEVAKIKDMEGFNLSSDKRYGVRIENIEDAKPDDIVLYDFKTEESTEIITSKSSMAEILDVELSADSKTVYYAEKQGNNALTKNDLDRKGPIFIKAAQVGDSDADSKEKLLVKLQSRFFGTNIIILRDENKLLLTTSSRGDTTTNYAKDFLQIDEFYLLDIKSGKTKKLLSVQGGLMRYDYSPATNSIIYTDDGRLPLKTIQVQ